MIHRYIIASRNSLAHDTYLNNIMHTLITTAHTAQVCIGTMHAHTHVHTTQTTNITKHSYSP